jgi:hypothetical protein
MSMSKKGMPTWLNLSGILVLTSGFWACKHDLPEPPPEDCQEGKVYYSKDIAPLLLSNCGMPGCHDAATSADGVNLSSYEELMNSGILNPNAPFNGDFWEVLNESDPDKRMPPSGPLSVAQLNVIQQWLSEGAPNSICTEGCDTSQFTWTGVIQPLIQSKCQGCHNASTQNGGINLASYSLVKTQALNGMLNKAIAGSGGVQLMPPGNPLPSCQLSQIESWIAAGAPEN